MWKCSTMDSTSKPTKLRMKMQRLFSSQRPAANRSTTRRTLSRASSGFWCKQKTQHHVAKKTSFLERARTSSSLGGVKDAARRDSLSDIREQVKNGIVAFRPGDTINDFFAAASNSAPAKRFRRFSARLSQRFALCDDDDDDCDASTSQQ